MNILNYSSGFEGFIGGIDSSGSFWLIGEEAKINLVKSF